MRARVIIYRGDGKKIELIYGGFLSTFYFIPKCLLDKCPAEIQNFPRRPRDLLYDEKAIEIANSDLFLLAMIDTLAYLVWPHLGIPGEMESYSGYDPGWRIAHCTSYWAEAMMEEATEILAQAVPAALQKHGLTAVLETVKEMRCEEDFDYRASHQKTDYYRKQYHTRSKHPQCSLEELQEKYIHILDWALHLDEGTPHIHERHVFDCENRYGELCPQQEKALEELGIPLPNPDKPKGRHNNRKQTFDAVCRTILFDITKRHGLHLDQEPSYGGREYLEKQDYILMKQKEQLTAQEQKLEELTLKIEDVETLLDDVSDVAYDKAVEVVTDTVRQETHKEDIRLIEETKKWVLSPERKAPQKERDYAAARLDGVITKIKRVMQSALAKIQKTLMQPEVKKAGKEQIKEKARESIRDKLAKGKLDADRDNRERWEREGRIAPTKKHDMEL